MERFSEYTGIPLGVPKGDESSVRIELSSVINPRIGAQGYAIHSLNRVITVSANDSEGAANGVYTFLRTLMIEHSKDPFSRSWDTEEKPAFSVRRIRVAPYRFGSSYGFAALSPDRWSFEQWKQYVDLMRLCNMTTLIMGSERVYDPDYPDSWRNKWRYEVWKQVMDYCHQVGIKFNWFTTPNLVPQQAFWDNPDKRAIQEGNFWYGNGLIWSKAKDIILKSQKYSLQYFGGMDGLDVLYSDGGGMSFDDATGADPAGYMADATRSLIKLMREVGNNGQLFYRNWGLDFRSQVFIAPALLEKYPKYKTFQDDVIPLLPKDVAWVDRSILTLIQTHGKTIQARGNPPLRECLLIGKEHGFKPVVDIFWYMNPERAINMFPHPYIRRAIQEAHYAHDELDVEGAEAYRLAPPMRFLGDYVFFRVASNPSLTQEQLAGELAGLLTEKQEDERPVKEAIDSLEQFWSTHKLADIEKADELFHGVLPQEQSRNLEYVSNGVTFLTYIVRMAQPGVTEERGAHLKKELYETVKPMYIMQGLTSDIVWIPEAVRFFNARVDMMIDDYRYYVTVPDVVDRSIYPRATSQPFQLRWPKQAIAETQKQAF